MTERKRPPTIHDVAARAGVSKSLVSLVMRDSPNVSDERRQAVLRAADELGYRPNAVARSLVRQRSGVLGCVLSDLHNPFFADVADGIDEGASAKGYRALFSSGFLDSDRESAAVDTLLQLRVDGLIVLGTVSGIGRFEAATRSVPVVTVSSESRSDAMDSVRDDDELGATMLIDHLVALGHSRITHIGAGSAAGGPERRRGYEKAMERHGIAEHTRVEPGAFTRRAGRAATESILATGPNPTAIFAPNDFAALGAIEALDAAGISVPGDISLVGYDNLAIGRLPRIDLTTVEQGAREQGLAAVRLLLDRIKSDSRETRHVVLPPTLVIGTTSGPPPRSP